MSELERSHIAQAILAYLAENPDAQDTLAGIAEWWLLEQQIKTQTATVKEVLAELVSGELILERKGQDSQIHYRINSGKLKEIKVMLEEKSASLRHD
jgi:hypothetical protein